MTKSECVGDVTTYRSRAHGLVRVYMSELSPSDKMVWSTPSFSKQSKMENEIDQPKESESSSHDQFTTLA
jgi:hypothetical protein